MTKTNDPDTDGFDIMEVDADAMAPSSLTTLSKTVLGIASPRE